MSDARTMFTGLVFVVTEEAVYRHRILGVFTTLHDAESRACAVANREDGHHDYCVWSCEINKPYDDDIDAVCRYERPNRTGNVERRLPYYTRPEGKP